MRTRTVIRLLTLLVVIQAASLAVACGQSIDQALIDDAVARALADPDVGSGTITAGAFEVVDGEGRVRAVIGLSDLGTGLFVRDARGVNRIAVALDSFDIPSLTLYDETGARRIGMQFALGMSPALFLRDTEGTLKAGMQVQHDGGPILFFRSGNAEDSFAVALIGNDEPVLSMAGPDGNHRILMGLDGADYDPQILFLDANGEETATLP